MQPRVFFSLNAFPPRAALVRPSGSIHSTYLAQGIRIAVRTCRTYRYMYVRSYPCRDMYSLRVGPTRTVTPGVHVPSLLASTLWYRYRPRGWPARGWPGATAASGARACRPRLVLCSVPLAAL